MKIFLKTLVWIVGVAGCFAFGYGWRNLRVGELPPASSLSALIGNRGQESQDPDRVFRENYNRILTEFYKPVQAKELRYAGLEGMFASLGDPHTLYLPPADAKEFDIQTHANFVGVGARMQTHPLGGRFVIIFDGSPAEKAGIKPGDLVTAADGKSLAGKPIEDVVGMIRGEEDTLVKLTIIRGNQKPFTVSVKRKSIITPTVSGSFLQASKVEFIQVAQFSEPTPEQFDKELDKGIAAGMKGLVIDLRGNPGGLLETAVDMLSRFAEDKVVVKMKGRDGREEVAKSMTGYLKNIKVPIVILMDSDSASAAEIFSGVMHDYRLATLVGDHSYGKASVQTVFALKDGSSAKVTIARYYLPSTPDIGRKVDEDGRYISGGLEPDFKVKLDPDAPVQFGDPKTDLQLAKAIQVIQSKG